MEEQRRFFHIMKTLWVSAGDGATQATGPADVMGETGRTPALGLVTRAPLSFTVKLCPNTCCHGDALHCKRLSGPQGLKTAHASPGAQSTDTHMLQARNQHALMLHPAGHTHQQAALDAYIIINAYINTLSTCTQVELNQT